MKIKLGMLLILKCKKWISPLFGVYHAEGHTFYSGGVAPGSVVVDLGANVGGFSKFIVQRFGSTCYAVEPIMQVIIPDPLKEKVKIFKMIIGNRDGQAEMNVSEDVQSHSLLFKRSFIEKRMIPSRTFPTWLRENQITKIDLLKIDIEGSEIALMDSMSDEALLSIGQMTIEFHDFVPSLSSEESVKKARKRLKKLGFQEYVMDTWYRMDCFYINPKRVKVPFLTRLYLLFLAGIFKARRLRARDFLFWRKHPKNRVAIFVSGSGTNMENLIRKMNAERIPAIPCLVVSDNPEAKAIEKAHALDVPVAVVSRKKFSTKEEFESAIEDYLRHHNINLICLAGFMRILSPEFVRRHKGQMINIHPSLLPAFPGARGIQDAFNAKAKETGVTVHYVDEGVDTGEVILQQKVFIDPSDTLESLEAKIHAVEYKIYPDALRKILS